MPYLLHKGDILMGLQLRKKLINATTFWYLLKLDKTMSANAAKSKKVQNRNVHKLMKKAYEVPFYRKRFDDNHLTPDDFHCSEDLVKFPLLTKDELRAWMKELYDTHPKERGLLGRYKHERFYRNSIKTLSVTAGARLRQRKLDPYFDVLWIQSFLWKNDHL